MSEQKKQIIALIIGGGFAIGLILVFSPPLWVMIAIESICFSILLAFYK